MQKLIHQFRVFKNSEGPNRLIYEGGNDKPEAKQEVQNPAEKLDLNELVKQLNNTKAQEVKKVDDLSKIITDRLAGPEISKMAPADLIKLCDGRFSGFDAVIAKNENTPTPVLEHIIQPYIDNPQGQSNMAILIVLRNKSMPKAVLEKVSKVSLYKFEDVREVNVQGAIAGNPNTPEQVLDDLLNDKRPSVQRLMALNPNCGERRLTIIAEFALQGDLKKDDRVDIFNAVLKNAKTPLSLRNNITEQLKVLATK